MVASEDPGVTWRVVIVGAALVAASSVISPWAILVVKGSQLTSNAIPAIAVFFLFMFVAFIQPLLRLLARRLAFSRAELIAVYVMMLAGSVVVTTGFAGSFLSVISGVLYYATPENGWGALFLPHLSGWLSPTDPDAVRLFYEGLPTDMEIPWGAWARPLAAWVSFLLVFYIALFCQAALLRGQWVENERLVYPLTRLPLAMVADENGAGFVGRLFTNRLMWLGFVLPLLLHSWNSLGNYSEAFQAIPVFGRIDLIPEMSIPIRLNLSFLGLAFLMPLNVAFSLWFFFLAGQTQRLVMSQIGIQLGSGDVWSSGGSGPMILAWQQAGAMMVFILFLLWNALPHVRRLLTGSRSLSAMGEPEPSGPRWALGTLLAGIVFMVIWLTLTGLSLFVSIILVIGAFAVFIGLSRIVAEAGLPGAQTPMVPQAFIVRGFGPGVLGLKNMTGLGLSTVWMGETAANMMNALVHALRLTSEAGGSRRYHRLPIAIAVAVVVGLAGSIWYTMHTAYVYGGINLHGWYYYGAPHWPFNYMSAVYNAPEPFLSRLGFTSVGAGIMTLLLFLRYRLTWWPLHPIGFPIANTYEIVYYGWFAIFLAWLIKALTLRYGGIGLYRALLPFFLGLALGEFATASTWVFLDGYFGHQGNMIFNR